MELLSEKMAQGYFTIKMELRKHEHALVYCDLQLQ